MNVAEVRVFYAMILSDFQRHVSMFTRRTGHIVKTEMRIKSKKRPWYIFADRTDELRHRIQFSLIDITRYQQRAYNENRRFLSFFHIPCNHFNILLGILIRCSAQSFVEVFAESFKIDLDTSVARKRMIRPSL